MNRRDFLIGGVASVGIPLSGLSRPINSLVASTGEKSETGGGGGWKNPYVTDGLVAMWDGEWSNGGDGKLIDISGNGYNATGNFLFDTASVSFTGRGQTDIDFPYSQMAFVEFVVARGTISEQMLLIGGGNRYNFAFYGYGGLCRGSGYGSSVAFAEREIGAAYFDMVNNRRWKNGSELMTTNHDSIGNTFSRMMIGQYNASGSYSFNGRWYSVRIHSRILTADEIAANYTVDKARFNLP